MEKKGKNAADFGLCFWAGRLSVQMPVGTEFTILSKDTDLDHVVNLLAKFDYKAERVGMVSENETSEVLQQKTTKLEIVTVADQYYQKTLSSRNRPATEDKLLNSIRSFCRKKCPGKEKAIFDILRERGYFDVLISGKIQYNVREISLSN